ncbi:hypothetical protein SNEBB_010389 [Seison nebaliae]|nr:hypothetical protein SNEBB_010389 [Seison nebaliae]
MSTAVNVKARQDGYEGRWTTDSENEDESLHLPLINELRGEILNRETEEENNKINDERSWIVNRSLDRIDRRKGSYIHSTNTNNNGENNNWRKNKKNDGNECRIEKKEKEEEGRRRINRSPANEKKDEDSVSILKCCNKSLNIFTDRLSLRSNELNISAQANLTDKVKHSIISKAIHNSNRSKTRNFLNVDVEIPVDQQQFKEELRNSILFHDSHHTNIVREKGKYLAKINPSYHHRNIFTKLIQGNISDHEYYIRKNFPNKLNRNLTYINNNHSHNNNNNNDNKNELNNNNNSNCYNNKNNCKGNSFAYQQPHPSLQHQEQKQEGELDGKGEDYQPFQKLQINVKKQLNTPEVFGRRIHSKWRNFGDSSNYDYYLNRVGKSQSVYIPTVNSDCSGTSGGQMSTFHPNYSYFSPKKTRQTTRPTFDKILPDTLKFNTAYPSINNNNQTSNNILNINQQYDSNNSQRNSDISPQLTYTHGNTNFSAAIHTRQPYAQPATKSNILISPQSSSSIERASKVYGKIEDNQTNKSIANDTNNKRSIHSVTLNIPNTPKEDVRTLHLDNLYGSHHNLSYNQNNLTSCTISSTRPTNLKTMNSGGMGKSLQLPEKDINHRLSKDSGFQTNTSSQSPVKNPDSSLLARAVSPRPRMTLMRSQRKQQSKRAMTQQIPESILSAARAIANQQRTNSIVDEESRSSWTKENTENPEKNPNDKMMLTPSLFSSSMKSDRLTPKNSEQTHRSVIDQTNYEKSDQSSQNHFVPNQHLHNNNQHPSHHRHTWISNDSDHINNRDDPNEFNSNSWNIRKSPTNSHSEALTQFQRTNSSFTPNETNSKNLTLNNQLNHLSIDNDENAYNRPMDYNTTNNGSVTYLQSKQDPKRSNRINRTLRNNYSINTKQIHPNNNNNEKINQPSSYKNDPVVTTTITTISSTISKDPILPTTSTTLSVMTTSSDNCRLPLSINDSFSLTYPSHSSQLSPTSETVSCNGDMKQQVRLLERRLAKMQRQQTEKLKNYERSIESLKQEKVMSDETANKLKSQIRDLNKEKSSLVNTVQTLKKSHQELLENREMDRSEYNNELNNLRDLLREHERRAKQFEKQLKEMKISFERTIKQNDLKKDEIIEMKEYIIKQKDNQIKMLENELMKTMGPSIVKRTSQASFKVLSSQHRKGFAAESADKVWQKTMRAKHKNKSSQKSGDSRRKTENFSEMKDCLVTVPKNQRNERAIRQALLDNAFLSKLSQYQVKQIINCMYPMHLPQDSYIIKEGDFGNTLYVLEGLS